MVEQKLRNAISREDLIIPAPDDFISEFGCAVDFDEETRTESYTFIDEIDQVLRMWIGVADCTFSLSVTREKAESMRLYDEFLSCIRLDEARKTIVITFDVNGFLQRMEISAWPRISISFARLRTK